MALYRHHEGQMTTYELTMGQIQTAKKHLALLDERRGRPRRRPRAAQLPAHARAQLRGARGPARVARLPAPGAAARSGPDPPAVGRAQARGVRRAAMKFALVTEIPAPYRIPLFNALAERLDLLVLFLAAEDPRRSFYDLHEQEWKFRARRACPAGACGPAVAGSCSATGSAAACGGSRPTRSASAGGTSRRSCARSRTRRRTASRSSRGSRAPHATSAAAARPLELAKRDARAFVRRLLRARDRRRSTTCGRSASSRNGSRSPRTPSTRACSPGRARRATGRCASSTSAGSTRRRASTCCCARSRTCRASSSSSARARRKPSCGHSPTTASGSRARCRETRSQSGTGGPTRSCCRRARSRGGWC